MARRHAGDHLYTVAEGAPEPKVVKNRVHLDVDLESLAAVDALVGLGATIIRRPGDDGDVRWFVMADPEDNEFCAFPPKG